jgi:hypothetical protein
VQDFRVASTPYDRQTLGSDPTKRTIEAVGKIFIGLLAVGWGLVLIPAGLRRRSERGSFSLLGLGASVAGLAAIARRSSQRSPAPLWSTDSAHGYTGGPVPPAIGIGGVRSESANRTGRPTRGPANQRFVSRHVKRQRQIVLGLLGTAVATLALAFVPGLSFFLAIHAAIDLAFALYLIALLRLKQTKGSVASRESVPRRATLPAGAPNRQSNPFSQAAGRDDYYRAS